MDGKRIGILGGTFNPIHNGHLILAEHAKTAFGLDKIIFIPTGKSPHKDDCYISSDYHRYNMVLLAINSNPHFSISPVEIEKADTSYTVNTIRILKSELKDSQIYFILGSDSLLEIHRWKDYEELLTLCSFIVDTRRGSDDHRAKKRIDELSNLYNSHIHILESPLIDISSTVIRKRIRDNQSIRYLVPRPVDLYIEKNRLYKE